MPTKRVVALVLASLAALIVLYGVVAGIALAYDGTVLIHVDDPGMMSIIAYGVACALGAGALALWQGADPNA